VHGGYARLLVVVGRFRYWWWVVVPLVVLGGRLIHGGRWWLCIFVVYVSGVSGGKF